MKVNFDEWTAPKREYNEEENPREWMESIQVRSGWKLATNGICIAGEPTDAEDSKCDKKFEQYIELMKLTELEIEVSDLKLIGSTVSLYDCFYDANYFRRIAACVEPSDGPLMVGLSNFDGSIVFGTATDSTRFLLARILGATEGDEDSGDDEEQGQQKDGRFWIVKGSGPSNFHHPSEESANTEAKRLAKEHPGSTFTVLEPLRSWRVDLHCQDLKVANENS